MRYTHVAEIARTLLNSGDAYEVQHVHDDEFYGTVQWKAPGEDVTVLVTVKVLDRE